jgi:hopanoid biosynthesis associated protein HpnK
LIVTADDFGLAPEVNDAVETGHRAGILSAASLMVGAPAAAGAVQRAKAMPRLRVGLHLALTDAQPVLPPEQIPDLVDRTGRLRRDLARLGVELALHARLRRQVSAEITAQFSHYRATGLPLDHVDVHQHFHLHPIVADMVIAIGRGFGLRGLRVPYEPCDVLARVQPAGKPARRGVERICAALLRAKVRRAGLAAADGVFGLRWSGAMTTQRLAALLERLPPGTWEIYLHPATSNEFAGHAPGYRYTDELAALTDPACIEAVRRVGYRIGGYDDVLADAAASDFQPAAEPDQRRVV